VVLQIAAKRNSKKSIDGVIVSLQEVSIIRRCCGSHVSGDELGSAARSAPSGIFCVDGSGFVQEWNSKAAQMTGMPYRQIRGKDFIDSCTWAQRQEVKDAVQQARRGLASSVVEVEVPNESGENRLLLLSVSPWTLSEGGNINGAVCIMEDITSLASRQSLRGDGAWWKNQYCNLMDGANAAVFALDTNGAIMEWNQRLADVSGHPRDKILGKVMPEEVAPKGDSALKAAMASLMVGNPREPFDMKIKVAGTDNTASVKVGMSPQYGKDGEIIGAFCVGQFYSETIQTVTTSSAPSPPPQQAPRQRQQQHRHQHQHQPSQPWELTGERREW